MISGVLKENISANSLINKLGQINTPCTPTLKRIQRKTCYKVLYEKMPRTTENSMKQAT